MIAEMISETIGLDRRRRARAHAAALGRVALVFAALAAAPAAAARFALVIGNNEGGPRDGRLRHAELDAQRMHDVLVRIGGFEPSSTVLLRGARVNDIRHALAQLRADLGRRAGDDLVFIYFSGHADAESLHVGADALPLPELKAAIAALPAAVRVVVVDACQSGSLIRAKGGTPAPLFELGGWQTLPRGLALVASSTESELAQESDQLGGSLFTHYLLAGLRGAADGNGDGRVSLVESFEFASRRTVAATVGSTTGPQHPVFRFELTGQQEVLLTFPGMAGSAYGRLVFDRPGWYFVRQLGQGALVTELVSRAGDEIVLDRGRYEVSRRDVGHLEVATLDVEAGRSLALGAVPKRTVAFGPVVRKGWGVRPQAYALAVSAGARSGVMGLGPSASAGVLGRVDTRQLSLELRAAAGWSVLGGEVRTVRTRELQASVAVLRAWDVRRFTLALGGELGWAGFSQEIDDEQPPRGMSHGAFVSPLATAEMALGNRLFLRLEAGVPVYLVRRLGPAGGADAAVGPSARVGGGAGFVF
jgi:hypothetical protein